MAGPTSIAVDDVVAAAAEGMIRALDARKVGASELVRNGFAVSIHIIAGGIPGPLMRSELNPQPLPPKE
jgi:hypothetical protein